MVATVKTLLAALLAVPALVAFGNGGRTLTASDVSRALLAQLNGSSAGHITKRVSCRLVAQTSDGRLRYACVLTGRLASTRALVTVAGTSWRAMFEPLRG